MNCLNGQFKLGNSLYFLYYIYKRSVHINNECWQRNWVGIYCGIHSDWYYVFYGTNIYLEVKIKVEVDVEMICSLWLLAIVCRNCWGGWMFISLVVAKEEIRQIEVDYRKCTHSNGIDASVEAFFDWIILCTCDWPP